MLVPGVPPVLIQAIKLLDPAVDSFMSCLGNSIELLGAGAEEGVTFCLNPRLKTPVACISYSLLPKKVEDLSQCPFEDFCVGQSPGTKWAMDPHNFGGADGHTKLISERRAIELV